MADTTPTFAFGTSGDVTAWTFNAGDTAQSRSFDGTNGSPTAGCYSVNLIGKNKNALNGDSTYDQTFEQLGVPAGSTITAISAASCRFRVSVFINSAVQADCAAYITPSGFAQIELAALRSVTSQEATWTTQSGAGASGLSIPSNTSCQLMIDHGQRTGNSNSSQVTTLIDTLTFTITYESAGTTYTQTVTSQIETMEDGTVRMALRGRTSSETLSVTDALIYAALRQRFSDDQFALIDHFIKVLESAGQTYTEVIDSLIEMVTDGQPYRVIEAVLIENATGDVSDATSQHAVRGRVSSEALTVTDAIAYARYRHRVSTDTLDLLDGYLKVLISTGQIYTETVDDFVTLVADSFAKFTLRHWLASETLAVSDSILSSALRLRRIEDAIANLWDESSYTLTSGAAIFTRTSESALAVVDGLLPFRRLNRAVAETITVTDATLARALRRRLMSDSVAIADAILSFRMLRRSTTDSLGLSDSILYDLISSGAFYVKVSSDGFDVIDEARRVLWAVRVQGDALTVTDAVIASARRTRRQDEALAVLDAIIRKAVRGRTVTETIAVTDSRTFRTIRNRAVAELAAVSDGIVAGRILSRALSDALLLTDSILSSVFGGVLIQAVLTDGLEVSDGLTRFVAYRRALPDALDVADAIHKVIRATRQDSLSVSDGTLYSRTFGRVTTDGLAVVDQALRFLQRVALASESISLSDGILTARISTRRISEVLEIADAIDYSITSGLEALIDVRIVIGVTRDSGIRIGAHYPVAVGVDDGHIKVGAYN